MPELPEVHALAVDLEARLKDRVIDRLDVPAVYPLKSYDPPASALDGKTITAVTRRGKFLDIVAEDLHLVVHLSLAGWVRWREKAPGERVSRRSPIAARLILEGGAGLDITEAGTRKALAIHVVHDPDEVPGIAKLGPDALDIDEAGLAEILASAGRARIKNVLKKQQIISGIGNAYSDEILHAAKMSPFQPANMEKDDISRLYTAMRETLLGAISRAEGQAASELKKEKKSALRVHGRFGEPCPVCEDTIQQVVYSGSSFQYCPTCQTGGKKLSNRGMDRLLK